ncbi:unnamed protein product [Calypogeia fissa]
MMTEVYIMRNTIESILFTLILHLEERTPDYSTIILNWEGTDARPRIYGIVVHHRPLTLISFETGLELLDWKVISLELPGWKVITGMSILIPISQTRRVTSHEVPSFTLLYGINCQQRLGESDVFRVLSGFDMFVTA